MAEKKIEQVQEEKLVKVGFGQGSNTGGEPL